MIKQFPAIHDLKLSEKLVYRIVYLSGPLTKNEILHHTGGSLSTVSRILNTLVEEGLVAEAAQLPKGSGRRPVYYQARPDAYFAYGAYITSEVYGIGLVNLAGDIMSKTQETLKPGVTPTQVADFFQSFSQRMEGEYGLTDRRVLGIGLSVIGPVLKEKGLLFHPHHLSLPDWQVVPLRDLFEMRVRYPATLAGLTETALLAEVVHGAARGEQSTLYVYLDVGIGCSMITHGEISLNHDNLVGGLGHMIIDFEGKRCVCGNRGCVEAYASVGAIRDRFQALGLRTRRPVPSKRQTTPAEVWRVASELVPLAEKVSRGDPKALDMIDEIATPLAVGLTNLVNLLRPGLILYGGRTVEQLEILFHRAVEKAKEISYLELFQDIRFRKSTFDDDLLIDGGGLLALDRYLGISSSLRTAT
jgi:predicted NBD/HSP70 family sugar kinase